MDRGDIPEGISGVDFPLALYDRPPLAFSNLLLRGDVDAATRAMLSPQTLTPAELTTFRSYLTKGRKVNPFLKTILDITTNPLFVLGLILSIKYPVGSLKPFAAIYEGNVALPKAWMLHEYAGSAFTNLRHLPGMIKQMMRHGTAISRFTNKFGEAMNAVFTSVKGIGPDDAIDAGALREGWGKEGASGLQKYLGLYVDPASFGKGTGPLIRDMETKMRPQAVSLSKGLGKWFDDIRDAFGPDFWKQWGKLRHELKAKGVEYGLVEKEDYLARMMTYHKYESAGLARYVEPKRFMSAVDDLVELGMSKQLIQRTGMPIPALEHIKNIAYRYGRPEIYDKLIAHVDDLVETTAKKVAGAYKEAGGNADIFVKKFENILRGMPWQIDIPAKFGRQDPILQGFRYAAERLGAANVRGVDALRNEAIDIARSFVAPAEYTLDVRVIAPKYLKSIAPTFVWHIGDIAKSAAERVPFGPAIMKLANRSDVPAGTQRYLFDNLLPMVRGFRTYRGMQMSAAFGEMRNRIFTWLRDHPLPKTKLGEEAHKRLLGFFGGPSPSITMEKAGSRIADWFYLSTLGAPNLSPTFKNTLQTWLTTANVIGMKGMGRGVTELLHRWPVYIANAPKMGHEVAFKKAFPEFVEATGEVGARMLDIAREGGVPVTGVAGKWLGAIRTAMMAPFSASETFLNRLLTFYGTRNTALAQGLTDAAGKSIANELGALMVNVTQFPGGPLNIPRLIMNIPPPLRQFAYFPLRYADFLATTVRLGPDAAVRHWGGIGRALMGSTAAYHGAKGLLGADISQGLLFGALPGPSYEGAPFFPFPFVPPTVAIGGAVAKSLATGEPEAVQNILPMLIPGGLGIRRLYQTFTPKYADYENRTPEGRIPVYNKSRALVGTFTPFELIMRSMGLTPTSMAAEWGAAEWLLKQREKVRWYRREYLEALSTNDLRRAEKLNNEFQKAYPELGPIQLKKSDITAVQNRREISRLNRIIKGFPKEYQPLFTRLISEATISQVSEDIEREPVNLGLYNSTISAL